MKLKKITGLFLTTALITSSLFGCGSDSSSSGDSKVSTFMDSMEAGMDIESYTYSSDINLSLSGDALMADMDAASLALLGITGDKISMNAKVSGDYVDESNMTMNLGFGMGNIKAEGIEAIIAKGTTYFNLKKVADIVTTIAKDITGEDVSVQLNALMPEKDYAAITKEMLTEYMNEIDTTGEVDGLTSIDQKKAMDFMNYISEEVYKAVRTGDKSAITQKGDVYTITINKSNINKVLKGFAKVIEKDGDKIFSKIKGIYGDPGFTAAELTSMASLLETYDVATLLGDSGKFELKISSEYTDGKHDMNLLLTADVEGVGIELGIKSLKEEKKDLKVTAPKSVIPKEELEALINGISQMVPETDSNTEIETDSSSDIEGLDDISDDETGDLGDLEGLEDLMSEY